MIAGRLNRAEGTRSRRFNQSEATRTRAWTELQAATARAEDRVEVDRAWERDQVTEHYLALLRSVQDLSIAYTEQVVPVYASTPIGDRHQAWRDLAAAHGRLMQRIVETMVVARPSVLAHLALLADIDVLVMVPIAHANGLPELAEQRANREHHLIDERTLQLASAMRVDLGIASDPVNKQVTAALQDATRKGDRSLASSSDPAQLNDRLRQLRVISLGGDPVDFRVDGTTLSRYQLPFRGLRRPVAGLMTIHEPRLALGVADDLSVDVELATLRGALRYVESGLRDGPSQRDIPDGGRLVAWFPQESAGQHMASR